MLTQSRALGLPSISRLMANLEKNDFVRHFLLGNGIVGKKGTYRIAEFILGHPTHIRTWYLVDNRIDSFKFAHLVHAWLSSSVSEVTSIWLKRNPLGSRASDDLVRLVGRLFIDCFLLYSLAHPLVTRSMRP